MNISIEQMSKSHIAEYAGLFASVFNAEPWNDSWTVDTARLRIEGFMNDNSFFGMELRDGGELVGIIFGQWEHYFDGRCFRIVEFCIMTSRQGSGYGKRLLETFRQELVSQGAVNIFLITEHGERTEGWYKRQGFSTGDNTIVMYRRTEQGE